MSSYHHGFVAPLTRKEFKIIYGSQNGYLLHVSHYKLVKWEFSHSRALKISVYESERKVSLYLTSLRKQDKFIARKIFNRSPDGMTLHLNFGTHTRKHGDEAAAANSVYEYFSRKSSPIFKDHRSAHDDNNKKDTLTYFYFDALTSLSRVLFFSSKIDFGKIILEA
jgi:hypothetical protein